VWGKSQNYIPKSSPIEGKKKQFEKANKQKNKQTNNQSQESYNSILLQNKVTEQSKYQNENENIFARLYRVTKRTKTTNWDCGNLRTKTAQSGQ
jgi:hypothetical protein